MVCPLKNGCFSFSKISETSSNEDNPLLDVISDSMRVCLAVAKYTENAKIYNQNRRKCHNVGCWDKVKRFFCCCCCTEKESPEGAITGLGLWMQEHIHLHGILVTGYAVYTSGLSWEDILERGTLSPGDQCQLKAALERSSTKLIQLILDSNCGCEGIFSPEMQEALLAQYRERVGIGDLADVLALRHFCNRA